MTQTLAFFNNKGGVGKTTLVYHLAHMFAEQRFRVLMVDLDPQSNLTAMCVSEDRLEALWPGSEHPDTILGCVRPIMRGLGDIKEPHLELMGSESRLALIPGDLGLSKFEDKLSAAWPITLEGDEAAFRTLSAFHRIAQLGAKTHRADLVLIDIGPNLGAINRAALLASENIITPLAPDLFSRQGLRNLGPTLKDWRQSWEERLKKKPPDLDLPGGLMNPRGYLVMQSGMRLSRPVQAYKRWIDRMPAQYHYSLLDETTNGLTPEEDKFCLGVMKNYQSLMPLAQDAQRPMFMLRPGDGAIGAHQQAVKRCYDDFAALARKIAKSTSLSRSHR